MQLTKIYTIVTSTLVITMTLWSCFNRGKEQSDVIGFTVKGPLTAEYITKLQMLDPDNVDLDSSLYMVEFYNYDTLPYYIESFRGYICYTAHELYFDAQGKIIAASTCCNFIPRNRIKLIKVEPGEQKILVSYFVPDRDDAMVRLSYRVAYDSTFATFKELYFDYYVQH